jgi:hypothetical protein
VTESILPVLDDELRARVAKGLPMLVVLGGMTDAGGVISQLGDYLWEQCAPEEILRFDADLLFDYRARRPFITFDQDHFVDYEAESLTLSLAHDALGSPFLMLTGFEPDFRWEQFVDAMLLLIDEFEVSITLWTIAIPMPVPHTRPIGATVSGTREDLIEARSVWKPTSKLPASVTHLLEYRLYALGEDVAGFALLVPHYLSNTEFPDVLLAALDSFMAATGLIFSTDEVRDASRDFHRQIDRQVADNEESLEMLRGLEARYDSYMEDQTSRSPLVHEDGTIPTADQLANELERFLAQQRESGPGEGQAPGL